MTKLPSAVVESPPSLETTPWPVWQHVTALCLVVVELCWVLPWYRTLIGREAALFLSPAPLVLGGIMLVSYAVAYWIEIMLLLRNVQLGVLAFVLAVVLVLAERLLMSASLVDALKNLLELEPGPGLLIVFVLWMWWRGISLARQTIHPHNAWRRFELGLALYMLHIFVVYRMQQAAPGLGWSMFFLFTGFLSVLFARISYIGLGRGGNGNPFNRRWLAGVSTIIAITVTAATILGYLLIGRGSLLLDGLSKAIRLLTQAILFIVAIPTLIVAFVLAPLLQLLQRVLPTPTPALTPTVTTPDPYWLPPEWPVTAETQPLPPIIQTLIFWGVILVLVLFLLWRLRTVKRAAAPAALGQPESLLGPGEAQDLLRKALQNAINDLAARLRPARRPLAVERVRQIYAALLDLCDEKDSPRPPGQTPLEFLPVMQALFPSADKDLEMITQAYLQVRYGKRPETAAQVQAVESAWKRISGQAQSEQR
ncbi:MAG: DUF4129 domain-containing protein [Anaerolineales bacterium]|nr:DUF4129 domain-containing protein [Anaerolineales bacterium]